MTPESSRDELEAYLRDELRRYRPDLGSEDAAELAATTAAQLPDSVEARRAFLDTYYRAAGSEADRKARASMVHAAEVTNEWIAENREMGGVCDFCADPLAPGSPGERVWTTDEPIKGSLSGLFGYESGVGAASMPLNYDPDWAACPRCDPVVALRDPERLAAHVIANRGARVADLDMDEQARQDLVQLYRAFFDRARRKESHVPLTRDEFYEQATRPETGDEMSYLIRRGENDDLERAFSLEAYEAVGYQMHDFLMARTLAYQARHGVMPRSLRAELRVVWDDERSDAELEEGPSPWYALDDSGTTMLPLDGSFRAGGAVFLERRRRRADQA